VADCILGQDHVHHHFVWHNAKSMSTAFLRGRRLGCAFNASWRVSSTRRLRTNCL